MTEPLLRDYREKNLLHVVPSPTSKIGYATASKLVESLRHH